MGGVDEIYLSNDGLWLATSHADGLIRVWNVKEAKEAYAPFEGYLPRGTPFSPDNSFLTYIYSPGKNQDDVIRVWWNWNPEILSQNYRLSPKIICSI